ncbi:MAG: GerMN domain-containing protein [Bacillota bacterium]|nr:GerMN domain-containing protein [Bacillota bacterium]
MMKRVIKSKVGMLMLTGILVFGLAVSGCGKAPDTKPGEGQPPISSQPAETKVNVTLYFPDDQAMYLVPEQREVEKRSETLEELVLRELVKGPAEADHGRAVPEEAKVISVNVVEGVAYENFSKELRTKHWGGSTGETMTIYAIVNSLTALDGIEKVQFLLEGEKMDTLAGHYDTSKPMGPNQELVK